MDSGGIWNVVEWVAPHSEHLSVTVTAPPSKLTVAKYRPVVCPRACRRSRHAGMSQLILNSWLGLDVLVTFAIR